jgi:hypothetical protein
MDMPLSEDEQRILQDIERSFYETDPKFAETVGSNSLYRHAGRNCKWAVAAFVVSLAVLLASFIRFPLIGFVGFVGMVAATVIFVKNIRRIGVVGIQDVAESDKAREVGQKVEDARRQFRRRFRRPE